VAQLCDFGLVRLIHDQMATGLTTSTAHTGTARYLSLELVGADEGIMMPTTSSDIWALGCVGVEVSIYIDYNSIANFASSSFMFNLHIAIFRPIVHLSGSIVRLAKGYCQPNNQSGPPERYQRCGVSLIHVGSPIQETDPLRGKYVHIS
jgi:serine/threonine protein kinase